MYDHILQFSDRNKHARGLNIFYAATTVINKSNILSYFEDLYLYNFIYIKSCENTISKNVRKHLEKFIFRVINFVG